MKNKVSKTDVIEALLFATEAPLPLDKIAAILEISESAAREEIEILRDEKSRIGGLQIVEVSGGWQMLTKPDLAPFVFKLREAPRQKLSRAAFEVLAVTAYRQPITRAEIEELRGVDCSRPLTFLLDKKLLQFGGRKDSPGRPWLYETTAQFLDHFGLRSIADLPPLAELAEMNEAALDSGARNLFSRGPMQEMEAPDEDEEMESGEAQATESESGTNSESPVGEADESVTGEPESDGAATNEAEETAAEESAPEESDIDEPSVSEAEEVGEAGETEANE